MLGWQSPTGTWSEFSFRITRLKISGQDLTLLALSSDVISALCCRHPGSHPDGLQHQLGGLAVRSPVRCGVHPHGAGQRRGQDVQDHRRSCDILPVLQPSAVQGPGGVHLHCQRLQQQPGPVHDYSSHERSVAGGDSHTSSSHNRSRVWLVKTGQFINQLTNY